MSDERKPCPFCGGGSSGGETDDGGRFIECVECGASTNLRYATGDDPWPLLVEAWNRRPAADESAKPIYQWCSPSNRWLDVTKAEFDNEPDRAKVRIVYSHPARTASKEAVTLSDEADAARYRWLRDVSTPSICAFYLSVGMGLHGVKFKPETVDEAIDAQIAQRDASKAEGQSS